MNKFAIYSACIGGYDNIVQPKVIDERFDFFLFTDEVKKQNIGVWQVRQVEYTNPDKIRIARYVKTHPHELLPEYKATLWMDSCIQICSSELYERVVELSGRNIDVAAIKHPKRDCIYEEAFEVASRDNPGALEYDEIALSWCHKLWMEHYPLHNGLMETGILYRQNNVIMADFNAMWWNCIDKYSRRDQLSFNYVLWRLNPIHSYFFPIGEHAFNSDKVRYMGHSNISKRKALPLSIFQHARYRFRVRNRDYAQKQWYAFMKNYCPILLLYSYGTFTAFIYMVCFKLKNS